jgi:hypothetical protein
MAHDYGEVVEERIIEKNSHQQWRVQRRESQKHGNFLDIRLWFTEGQTKRTSDGGEEFVFRASPSGIRCSTKHGPKLAAAISELGDAAEETEEDS